MPKNLAHHARDGKQFQRYNPSGKLTRGTSVAPARMLWLRRLATRELLPALWLALVVQGEISSLAWNASYTKEEISRR